MNKHQIIGASESIQSLRKLTDRIRQSKANVLITGETGTGKEAVARALRKFDLNGIYEPFITVDSSTIQTSTAESILFGHEKGAFTGADQVKKGIFEEAHGGIVYFDEVGNMPLEIQSKLLRVIQEREFARLGSNQVTSADFRVVCATNCNLEQMSKSGTFKFDLLQRLNVVVLEVPPLRERKGDLPALLDYFSKKFSDPPMTFNLEVIQFLHNYEWPGNIRELSNLVECLAVTSEKLEITSEDLPLKVKRSFSSHEKSVFSLSEAYPFLSPHEFNAEDQKSKESFYEKVAFYEKNLLKREYSKQNGNISLLAETLHMDRSHLYSKLKGFGIIASKSQKNLKVN